MKWAHHLSPADPKTGYAARNTTCESLLSLLRNVCVTYTRCMDSPVLFYQGHLLFVCLFVCLFLRLGLPWAQYKSISKFASQ